MQEQGYILKGVGGFYTVRTPQGEELVCKARGRFRLDGISPLCGDRVCFVRQAEGHALLDEILPRKNLLVRPPVANIDQLLIVLSVGVPKPDLLLCDKLLLSAAQHNIHPLIVFNKCDQASPEDADAYIRQYSPAYDTLLVSAQTGRGMDALSARLDGRISCFAGQSAVGKSSLLNTLIPALSLPVGTLAKKTDRGRHTTRHAQLWPYRGGAVLDTAGFSLLDLQPLTQSELNAAYREFGDAPDRCRFAACAHHTEPDCAVKALLQAGTLPAARYARYLEINQQLEEMRKHQYDQ